MALSSRVDELRRRVQQDPASIAFAALAEEYRRAELYQNAIEVCRAGLQRHPAYLSARVTLGRALVEVGELEEGREHLEQVLRIAPENLAAIRALADIHRRRAEYSGSDLHAEEMPAEEAAPSEPVAVASPKVEPAPSVPLVVATPPVEPRIRLAVATRPMPDENEADRARADENAAALAATLAQLDAFLDGIGRARETLLSGGHASLSR